MIILLQLKSIILFMNFVWSGGKQPKMRPGWYAMGPMIVKQHMVFPDGPNAGLAKGLRVVCQERFGEEAVQGINID